MKNVLVVMSIIVCNWLCVYAMDTKGLYIKLKGDVLTTLDRDLLPSLKTLVDMKGDFPEGGEVVDNPIPLLNMSMDRFGQLVRLLILVKNFIKENPQNNTVEAIKKKIWAYVENKPDRYILLEQFITDGDYLDIDPEIKNALELCISTPLHTQEVRLLENIFVPATIDIALRAGLRTINNLNSQSLIPIKEAIISNIVRNVEKTIIANANNDPKKIITIHLPNESNNWPTPYLQRNNFVRSDFDFSKNGAFFVCGDGRIPTRYINIYRRNNNNTVNIQKIDIASMMPQMKLTQMPNQEIVVNRFPDLSIEEINELASYGPNDFFDATAYEIKISPDSNYIVCVFGDTESLRGSSLIINQASGKYMLLPDFINFFSSFKAQNGKEKLICITGTENTKNKLIYIENDLSIVRIVETQDIHHIRGICLVENLLIYSDFYSQPGFCIFDLLSDTSIQIHINNSTDDESSEDSASHNEKSFEKLEAWIEGDQLYVNAHSDIDTVPSLLYKIKKSTLNKSIDFKVLSTQAVLKQAPKNCSLLPSHHFISNCEGVVIERDNGSIELIKYDQQKNYIEITEPIPQNKMHFFNYIKQLISLTIEQLYMLEEVTYRLSTGTFTIMTAVEEKLFNSMPTTTYKRFNIFFSWSKPIVNQYELTSIVDPGKTGAFDTPLRGYIQKGKEEYPETKERGGIKRKAPDQETPEEIVHTAKKQRTIGKESIKKTSKKSDSDNDSNKEYDKESDDETVLSDDETVLDESLDGSTGS